MGAGPSVFARQPPPLGGGEGEGSTLVPPAGNFDPLRSDAFSLGGAESGGGVWGWFFYGGAGGAGGLCEGGIFPQGIRNLL